MGSVPSMSEFERDEVDAAIARARHARRERFGSFFVGLALVAGLLVLLVGVLWMQGQGGAGDPVTTTSITRPGG